MSSRMNKSTNFRVIVCCKVCKDAGKPESEYLTHFVKDREGNVICPTLLSLNCKYCQKPGHTISHCPTLQAKNKANEKAKRKAEFSTKKDAVKMDTNKKTQSKFGFELLDQEEEEMSEEIPIHYPQSPLVLEEFPSLLGDALPLIAPVHAGGTTYASMAAKTIEEFENEQFEKKIRENALKNIKIATQVSLAEKKAPLKLSEINWAMDDSDSDDDW